MSLKDYIIRDIQEKFKYLPSAVYLALICIAMYIFVCLLRYLFTMREVSQADERRKKIVGKIWHMLFCGTFVAYMYTLEKMGLDYLDMMIIHSPQPWAKVNQCEDRYVEGNRAAWKALEDAYKAGKLKAIGISNFLIEDIASLLETAKIKPMVNQILLHISNTPIELVEYCQKNNIAVEAYSPIAHGEILNQPEITTIAKKYGVTVPQLCIRYTLQLGAISLPKTGNPEHMKSNAQLDFEISAEDMELLKNFKKIKSYGDSGVFPVYGGKM